MVGGQIQPQNRCLHLFCNIGINTQTAVHAYLPHGCCQSSSSRENFDHVKIVDGPARNPLKKSFSWKTLSASNLSQTLRSAVGPTEGERDLGCWASKLRSCPAVSKFLVDKGVCPPSHGFCALGHWCAECCPKQRMHTWHPLLQSAPGSAKEQPLLRFCSCSRSSCRTWGFDEAPPALWASGPCLTCLGPCLCPLLFSLVMHPFSQVALWRAFQMVCPPSQVAVA